MSRPLWRIAAVLLAVCGAAAYSVLVSFHRPSILANDVYAQFIPNIVHAIRALGDGGQGLLWNPFQASGRPFFANPIIGLLYPPHVLFLLFDVNTAVHLVLALNMVAGALGMLLLCRELGLGWTASLAGAIAFEIGAPMIELSSWSPTHNGPWAWIPWVLLFCERLLRVPTALSMIGLAVAVALELLPGFPLIPALTYQFVALRVLFELVARRGERPWRSAAAIAAGLVLGPLLAAVQLVPAAELAMHSNRVMAFAWEPVHRRSLTRLFSYTVSRAAPVPFLVTPLLLIVAAPLLPARRRLAAFYLVVGAVHAVAALGTATPLYGWYAKLPMVAETVRVHVRLFWITGLCLAFLAALGVQALEDAHAAPVSRRVVAVVMGALALWLYYVAPGGLRPAELVTLIVVAAAGIVCMRPSLRRYGAWAIVAALTVNLIAVPIRWPGSLRSSADFLWHHAVSLAELSRQLTPQDRVLLMPSVADASNGRFVDKTSTLLRLPNVGDYEALLDARFYTYFITMMLKGPPLGQISNRLLDLASVRFLITSSRVDATAKGIREPQVSIDTPQLRAYRNDSALPRARFVPRIEVIRDANVLLERLADGDADLARVAFVEELPASGFTGSAEIEGTADSRILTNDPEHLVIRVEAPQRGFLVVADSYFPGWRATVDGDDTPILRANYTFRLVEVPAGTSTVEFRYRPMSVLIGAVLSAVGILIVAGILISQRRKARRNRECRR